MTQPIWYDSSEAGAPSLNNTAGSLLEVLRACLVNGLGARAISSISVAAGVATVTSATHGFSGLYGKLVLVAGASQALLNGRKQPGNITTNTFTFPAPGVPDGTYTGGMSARRAPLGWVEDFSGTNLAVLRRSAPEATAMKLRVDDTGTITRVRMVETATDVNTFTSPTPTDAQLAGGGYWQKASSATVNAWFLVGDERGFWLGTRISAANGTYVYYWFGDGKPYYAADAYFCLITTQSNTAFSITPGFAPAGTTSYGNAPGNNAANGPVAARGLEPTSLSAEIQALAGPNAPSTFGNTVLQPTTFEHVVMVEALHVIGANKVVRGEMPGLCAPLAAEPFTPLVPVTSAAGAVYLPVRFNNAGTQGMMCLRLSGDWY